MRTVENGHQSADERFMRLALQLAARGRGRTSPNPMVGAVLVKRGQVIAQGYHRLVGGPHAEIEALRQAGRRARQATLYVTLEPCRHHGRTPPCTGALLAAGLKRVVIAARDPNPLMNGRSIRQLKQAGLDVRVGFLQEPARRLNAGFEKVMRQGLPHVVAKVAQSLDGKIATASGESRWITSAASRRMTHLLRREADAVLVGIKTVLADDPRLSARGGGFRQPQPIKVILDSRLRAPATARCLSAAPSGRAVVATTVRNAAKQRRLERRGAQVLVLPPRPDGRVPLRPLFKALARQGVQRLLLEGGGEVLAGALEERLVDRVVWFLAPVLLGGRSAPGAVGGRGASRLRDAIRLDDIRIRRLGPDLCVEGRVVYPGS